VKIRRVQTVVPQRLLADIKKKNYTKKNAPERQKRGPSEIIAKKKEEEKREEVNTAAPF